ncbi:MAG: hypothetical protein ACJ70Q_02210 [Nitrososphaera sp.]
MSRNKGTFARGETMKDGFITLQADYTDEAKGYLLKMGFNQQGIEDQQ